KDGAPDLNAGNYKTLRLWVHTLHPTPEVFDAQVIGFDTAGRFGVERDPLRPLPSLDESLEAGQPIKHIWVRWPDDIDLPAAITHGALVHLYAPGHEPTQTYPLHVGVQDAGHPWGSDGRGLHPFELVKRIYDQAGVRYDPDAFSALIADPQYPRGAWRITEPQRVAEWVERHIYQPTQVLPFVDNQGRIAPRSLIPPAGLNPSTLFVFDISNTREPYPTFDHQDGEVANVVVPTLELERAVMSDDPADHDALDGFEVESAELEPIKHDTVTTDPPLTPEKPVRMDVTGWQPYSEYFAPRYTRYADHILQRFGDGPITQVIY